jgi:hypothetical protein
MVITLVFSFSITNADLVNSNVFLAVLDWLLLVLGFLTQGIFFINNSFEFRDNLILFYFFSFSPFLLILSYSVGLYMSAYREFIIRWINFFRLINDKKHEHFYIITRGKDEDVNDYGSFLKAKKSITFLVDRQYGLTDPGRDFTSKLSLSGFAYNNQYNFYNRDKAITFLKNHSNQNLFIFFKTKITFIVLEDKIGVLEQILSQLHEVSKFNQFDVHVITDHHQMIDSLNSGNGEFYQTSIKELESYHIANQYPLFKLIDLKNTQKLNLTFIGPNSNFFNLSKILLYLYMPFDPLNEKSTNFNLILLLYNFIHSKIIKKAHM